MPAPASAGSTSLVQHAILVGDQRVRLVRQIATTARAARAASCRAAAPWRGAARCRPATRISKNSSRLLLTMHRKRSRSSSGTAASSASASTRRLNASSDSSRLISGGAARLGGAVLAASRMSTAPCDGSSAANPSVSPTAGYGACYRRARHRAATRPATGTRPWRFAIELRPGRRRARRAPRPRAGRGSAQRGQRRRQPSPTVTAAASTMSIVSDSWPRVIAR